MVNVRASLAELCLKSDKAVWKPVSSESTKAIFQQASRATLPFSALCNFLAPSLSVRRPRSGGCRAAGCCHSQLPPSATPGGKLPNHINSYVNLYVNLYVKSYVNLYVIRCGRRDLPRASDAAAFVPDSFSIDLSLAVAP